MQYCINRHLSMSQIKLLKGLKGNILNKISFVDTGDFIFDIVIDSTNCKLSINNIPTIQLDGDEYPKFEIQLVTNEKKDLKEITMGKLVNAVKIIRDEATWSNCNEKWLVHIDIGIRVILEDSELLLIAHDSIAGLIRMINLEESSEYVNAVLDEYWSMKTRKLESLKRWELEI